MKKIFIYCFVFVAFGVHAQNQWFQGSFYSNSAYYLDDDKTGDFNEEDRFRSNNYLRLSYGYGKFSAGIQLESFVPKALLNYSPNLDKELGVGMYYLNYKSDLFDVRLGSIYEHFGSGLVLRFWEDKQLGIDNALMGVRTNIRPSDGFHFTALYGKQRKGFELSSGRIFGLNSEIDLAKFLNAKAQGITLGMSYVSREQRVDNNVGEIPTRTSAYSGRLAISNDSWYSNIEYVHKSEDALVELGTILPGSINEGSGLLVNAGYSRRGFGLDANFRRVENMGYYTDREAAGNIYNEQLINYIPALTNQYDYSLANIYLYQAQYGLSFNPLYKSGEIGNQLSVYYSFKRNSKFGGKYGTKLALNFSNWYGLKASYDVVDRSYSSEFFGFGERYFTELNLELRKKWSKQWSGIFNFINLYYNKRFIEETSGEVDATLLLADISYNFQPVKSLRFEVQHLWTEDDQKNWLAGTLELNLSTKWSIFVADLYNYGNENDKIHYYNFGGSYSKKGTRISLNYGRQRGGLLCVGGVCRVVPETTGFGLSVATSF